MARVALVLTAIIAFIAQIPGLASLASTWATARYNAQVSITTARIGGDVEAAKAIVAAQVATEQARVAGLGVIAGSTLLTVLVVLFALPIVGFMWKVILWDVVVGAFQGCAGTFHPKDAAEAAAHVAACATFDTDPIKGQVADYMGTVIWAIFGSTAAAGGISGAVSLVRGK